LTVKEWLKNWRKLNFEIRASKEALDAYCERVKKEFEPKTETDNINHPSHYTDGKIEVIDFIEDKKLPYHLGNVIKYISRAGKKNPDTELEDLKKAQWYLSRYIELKEGADK